MRFKSLTFVASVSFLIAGCQTIKDAPNMATLGVSFEWQAKHGCSSTPPAFQISNIPDGTKTLNINMTDLDFPPWPHGGGTVAYKGSGNIPEGSFRYDGPCPPNGETHEYQFTVRAINATGDTVLGKGKYSQSFKIK
jgi:phosphatidylethanolamine-binding protein (PEBP) family uncharacterized protein